jgi:dihydroneopterin aldolase
MFGVAASSSFYRQSCDAAPLPLKAERRIPSRLGLKGNGDITFKPSPSSDHLCDILHLEAEGAIHFTLSACRMQTESTFSPAQLVSAPFLFEISMLSFVFTGSTVHEQLTMSLNDDSVVSRTVWKAHPDQVAVTDKITVRNLQASVDAGVDVWGRPKKQRALLTVTLSLAKPFDSAAQADALDSSTVHYGILSKAIQAHVDGQADRLGSGHLVNNICDVARSTAGGTALASVEVGIFYPKGSMFGDGAGFSLGIASLPDRKTYRQLHLRNVRVPCLIGVNANERQQKQPVIVNIWVDCLAAHRNDDYQKLETTVVDVRACLRYYHGC